MKKKIKTVLKIFLPLALLRRVQLELNKLRIKTIDKYRFPEQPFQQEEFIIWRDDYPFQIYSIKTEHLEPRLRWQFEQDNHNWTQNEYLLVYNKSCIIEPRHGWAISPENRLIYPSLGYSRASYLPKPAGKIKDLHNASLEEYSQLISLRDTGEENYYHFYNDILAKLFFIEEKLNISPAVPLLISKRLYDRPFFQYFLAHPYLSDRRWVIQDEQYIRSHLTYFCKPLAHSPKYYSRILGMVHPEDWCGVNILNRRLFVTRGPKRLRVIENNVDIADICQEMGFEIVDFDELSFSQQIQTMRQTRYMVGIHGAGLANMLFRGDQPMSILEIYPPEDYFPCHYIMMANQLGYRYDGLIGLPGSHQFSGGFRVDPAKLRQRLAMLLLS